LKLFQESRQRGNKGKLWRGEIKENYGGGKFNHDKL
jgi:hypothetical protein